MGARAPKFLAISIGTNEDVGPVGNRLRPMGLVKNQICGVFDVDNGIGGPVLSQGQWGDSFSIARCGSSTMSS